MHDISHRLTLAVLFPLALLAVQRLAAQPADPAEVAITGGRFTQLGDTVFISYHLLLPEDEEVRISVKLRRGEDSTFSIVPVSATGAIGEVRGGGDKVIIWKYRNDVPPEFEFGNDYWFEFEGLVEKGGLGWLPYAIGGVVIAGAAILVSSSDDSPSAGGEYVLPGPPNVRPPDE